MKIYRSTGSNRLVYLKPEQISLAGVLRHPGVDICLDFSLNGLESNNLKGATVSLLLSRGDEDQKGVIFEDDFTSHRLFEEIGLSLENLMETSDPKECINHCLCQALANMSKLEVMLFKEKESSGSRLIFTFTKEYYSAIASRQFLDYKNYFEMI